MEKIKPQKKPKPKVKPKVKAKVQSKPKKKSTASLVEEQNARLETMYERLVDIHRYLDILDEKLDKILKHQKEQ